MIDSVDKSAWYISGGRVIDPATGRDEVADVAVVDGVIAAEAPANAAVIDAKGLIVAPGLMDIHVHLRDPGQTHKECIESGAAAAVAGGFTLVACMPNTAPTLDEPAVVRSVVEKAKEAALARVAPIAAMTRNREGRVLVDFAALLDAGAVAFSDDGVGVEDDAIMLAVFEKAAEHKTVLIQHCEYRAISDGGVMHLGDVSRKLGLPGLDPRSEEAMIERDIVLCRQTRGRYHVAHISTAQGVELVRQAKADGIPVTAEVCPHHLLLTDEACASEDPNTKMHPPLRPQRDVEACRQGLVDGTIDCIVTDHAPHTAKEKSVGFVKAPPGIVGLETAVGLAARALIDTKLADWSQLVKWFTTGPAGVLGLAVPTLSPGVTANLTLIDPKKEWVVDPKGFSSQSRNTPFQDWKLTGRPLATMIGSRCMAAGGGLNGRIRLG